MKQFNLEEYLRLKEEGKEPKIVTRSGYSVRIICTNRKSQYGSVVTLVNNGIEAIWSFYENGKYFRNKESDRDLFFADLEEEPKYRPYKDAEECFKDVVKHGGWVKNTSGQYLLVIAVTRGGLTYSGNILFPFERACCCWVWADDNSPVGAKEE